ncbi:MAG: potassium channel family protein [Blastocatellia bacterium]
MAPGKRLYYPIIAILALILIGTLGYQIIEGWSWFDGLYMTIITLATIGYGEVNLLSTAGRVFTLLLIMLGVTMFGYLLSQLTHTLIESEITLALGKRKVYRDISKLTNHYIVVAAGRVGLQVIDELRKKNVDFVVIERNEQVAERLLARGDLVLIGDATNETVLEGANIRNARALITSASDNADNVYVVLTARGLNPGLHIVSRASDKSAEKQLMRAGANKAVTPTIGHQIAQSAMSPAVADFIELTTSAQSLDLGFEQIRITPGSPLDGRRLRDAGIRTQHNAMVVAITDSSGKMHFNPDGDYQLRPGDLLIAIGTLAGLGSLAETADYTRGNTARLPKLS